MSLQARLTCVRYTCGTPTWDTYRVHQQVALSVLRGKLTLSASAPLHLPSHGSGSLPAHEQIFSFLPSHDSHQLPRTSGSH